MPYRYKADSPDNFVFVPQRRPVDLSSLNAVSGARRATPAVNADGAVVQADVGGNVTVPVVVNAGDEMSDADWVAWDMENQPAGAYWEEIT